MAGEWASTDDHAPVAISQTNQWASTDDHAPQVEATGYAGIPQLNQFMAAHPTLQNVLQMPLHLLEGKSFTGLPPDPRLVSAEMRPPLGGLLMPIPLPEGAPAAIAAGWRGFGKGMLETQKVLGFPLPKAVAGAVAGHTAGRLIGSPEVGAAIGALAPGVAGFVRGFRSMPIGEQEFVTNTASAVNPARSLDLDPPPESGLPMEDTALLDQISQGMGGKSFKSLSPEGQATVRSLASRVQGASAAPPATSAAPLSVPPPPGAPASQSAPPSVPAGRGFPNQMPEGDLRIVHSNTVRFNQIAKDAAMARRFMGLNMTPEQVGQMGDSDLIQHIKDAGYEAPRRNAGTATSSQRPLPQVRSDIVTEMRRHLGQIPPPPGQ